MKERSHPDPPPSSESVDLPHGDPECVETPPPCPEGESISINPRIDTMVYSGRRSRNEVELVRLSDKFGCDYNKIVIQIHKTCFQISLNQEVDSGSPISGNKRTT